MYTLPSDNLDSGRCHSDGNKEKIIPSGTRKAIPYLSSLHRKGLTVILAPWHVPTISRPLFPLYRVLPVCADAVMGPFGSL